MPVVFRLGGNGHAVVMALPSRKAHKPGLRVVILFVDPPGRWGWSDRAADAVSAGPGFVEEGRSLCG